ncbi:MAG TPA: MFS transporter [Geminicoccaceae bacterium]
MARPLAEVVRGSILALAVAETLVWAGTFYLFPALLLHFERELGWSKTELAGAFTAALLTSAAAAPLVGRVIDRGFGRGLLTSSALGAGILLLLLALVEARWQFYAVWLGLGLAMAGGLYEPCFAWLIRTRGDGARRAITRITLIAGFAGTVSFPTANAIADRLGWRASALAFAALIMLLAVPLMWLGATPPGDRAPAHGAGEAGAGRPADRGALARAMSTPAFWLLGAAFTMIAFNHGILITHLLPLLAERGVGLETSVLAVSLIGPMQVAGRLLMLAGERRVPLGAVCAISFIAMIAASTLLWLAGAGVALLLAFVALQGAGYGVTSITRPAITADYLGRAGFGVISGAIGSAFMAANAAAPTVAALIWTSGGYDLVLMTCILAAVLGLAAFAAASAPVVRGRR